MSAAKFITLHIRRRLAGKLHFSYGVAAGDVWAPVTLLTADESLNMHETPGKHAGWRTDVLPVAKRIHNKICRAFQSLFRKLGIPASPRLADSGCQRNLARSERGDWFEGAPTIAIEIVSPYNSAEAIDRKTEAYVEEGAAEVWIVYPATRTMKVFRKDRKSICVTGIYDCASIGLQVKSRSA